VTVQAAWLVGDRLTTANVTSLRGDKAWTIEAALSTAAFVSRGRSRRPVD